MAALRCGVRVSIQYLATYRRRCNRFKQAGAVTCRTAVVHTPPYSVRTVCGLVRHHQASGSLSVRHARTRVLPSVTLAYARRSF